MGRVIITRTTSSKERPAAFGSLSLAQCGGYVLGPSFIQYSILLIILLAIAFGCGFLREDYNIYFKNSLIMNSLSIPGYVTAFLCFVYLIILVFAFREPPTWGRESTVRASDSNFHQNIK